MGIEKNEIKTQIKSFYFKQEQGLTKTANNLKLPEDIVSLFRKNKQNVWSKQDQERFLEAYRNIGHDYVQIAVAMGDKTIS